MTLPWERSLALQHCSKALGMELFPPGCMEPPPPQQKAEKSWPDSNAWLALSPRTLTLQCASLHLGLSLIKLQALDGSPHPGHS